MAEARGSGLAAKLGWPWRISLTARILAVNVIAAADAGGEQQPAPPIQGVTGTIATETSTQEVESGARALLVKAKRLFRWNRRATPAGEEGSEEAVAGFTPCQGMTGCGARQRRSPTGGAAKGTPK